MQDAFCQPQMHETLSQLLSNAMCTVCTAMYYTCCVYKLFSFLLKNTHPATMLILAKPEAVTTVK